MNYENLGLILLLALGLAFILSKLKISPIIAYLLAGVIGTSYLGINFNSPYFSLITSLALNLIAFEIGSGFDISKARELFTRALTIALVEMTLIVMISYYTGIFILHLGTIGSAFLILASIDTSTSIIYKLTGGNKKFDLLIAVASIEDIEVFFIYSILVALGGSFSLTKIISIVLQVVIASFMIYVFAKFFLNRVLFKPSRIEDESILTLLPIALVFIFAAISQITGVPETLTMILAGIAFSSVSGSGKVIQYISPIREFALIFFFLSVGGLLKINISITTFMLISFLIILIKYFSFSTANWITGSRFVDSFVDGIYMIPLSEFGIITSLDAIQQGINIYAVYIISIVVVILSSILASVIIPRVDRIRKLLNRTYSNSKVLLQMDLAISWFNKTVVKNITPISKSTLLKSFIQITFYIIVPFFLFPTLYRFEDAILSPLRISWLFYPFFAFSVFLAIVLLLRFTIEMVRVYYTLLGEIIIRAHNLKSKLIREFWNGIVDIAGHGVTFYILVVMLFYVALELPVVVEHIPSFIVGPGILVGFIGSMIYIRRIRFKTITKFYLFSKRKPNQKSIIKLTKNVILKMKKNKERIIAPNE
ncbi:cation:proton antiporter [Acidianus manzaensis]|uniref:Sodium:proton antiporter n=1 Tax=Acidianus manzaensis TaxID=282676 RepID=A0A1W6K2L8_9CREN|nr:cation:proton antiporter [Acidianus manzaensis]ARM76684.1 sodium:proton antiporter [Acidianus manzaensis]